MKKNKYLVTGASGFIGSSIHRFLNKNEDNVVGIGRRYVSEKGYSQCDIFNNLKLTNLLKDVTCVVHCAGYAHAFNVRTHEAKDAAWRLNYEATVNLMKIAVDAGVGTFIYLSSVKAMGNPGAQCIDESWRCNPDDDYGKSKLAAEEHISIIGLQSGVRVINLRLAMVYGAGGRGNLDRMSHYVGRNMFPPIPETHNRRSMVHVHDVLQAIMCVANDSRYVSGVYIVSGSESPSGRHLYNQLRLAHHMNPISIEIPRGLLEFIACICDLIQYILRRRLTFNRESLDRLLNSECYSSDKLKNTGSWTPKVCLKMGLKELVNHKTVK